MLRTLRLLAALLASAWCAIPSATQAQTPFEWRGAMLDLSRHFFPIEHVYRQVDVLAAHNINRLHLHLTDAAGWRMEIKAYPRLTSVAAWRTGDTLDDWWDGDRAYGGSYGGYYTQDELRNLVRYAEERGVIIVPEIEMPGHSEEVFAAYPELLCEGGRVSGAGVEHGTAQADFCAGNEATYTFLFRVLDEVMDVFPAPYIHIGGDEAGRRMWETCSHCQQRMQQLGLTTTAQLQAWLIRRVCDYLTAHGRQTVAWDEVLEGWTEMEQRTHSLTPKTQKPIIMCWRGQDKAAEATSQGFRVILCPGSHCYLDKAQDAPPTQPVSSGGYLPLDKVYGYNPLEGISEHRELVLGLQGNLWAEHIATPAHAEYMLYPRIFALAEIGMGRRYDYPEFRRRTVEDVRALRNNGCNAFDLEQEVGERPEQGQPAQHLARGCKVTYNAPWHPYYKAAAEATLTDGLRGGWANNDGRWQGFIGRRGMDVTIDLGQEHDIHTITADFQQICQPDIYEPAEFIVSTGTTEDDLHELHRISTQVIRTFVPSIATRHWQGTARCRYIRIQALPSPQYGGWIFCDEVRVE